MTNYIIDKKKLKEILLMHKTFLSKKCKEMMSKGIDITKLTYRETDKITDEFIEIMINQLPSEWINANNPPPDKFNVYWVAYEINGRLKSHYCIWEEKSRKYQGNKWGWRSREAVRRENIKFWMEIPNPPCQADEKINSQK